MSLTGAKVMNAAAVQFAKEANIALYARSTFESGKETIIRRLSPGTPKGVKAVVSESEIVRVRISGEDSKNVFDNLLTFFEKNQISLKELNYYSNASKIQSVSFIISWANIYGWDKIKEQLLADYGKKIVVEENLSAISLIGEGLTSDVDILTETLAHLENRGIRIFGITTTSFRISLLIERNKIKDAVKLCHQKWIE
jgi:aspartate kinase